MSGVLLSVFIAKLLITVISIYVMMTGLVKIKAVHNIMTDIKVDTEETAGAALAAGGSISGVAGWTMTGYEWINVFVALLGLVVFSYRAYHRVKSDRERLKLEREIFEAGKKKDRE